MKEPPACRFGSRPRSTSTRNKSWQVEWQRPVHQSNTPNIATHSISLSIKRGLWKFGVSRRVRPRAPLENNRGGLAVSQAEAKCRLSACRGITIQSPDLTSRYTRENVELVNR